MTIPGFVITYRIHTLSYTEQRPSLTHGNVVSISADELVLETSDPAEVEAFVVRLPELNGDADFVQDVEIMSVEHNVDGFHTRLHIPNRAGRFDEPAKERP